jgi:hypothetical protein
MVGDQVSTVGVRRGGADFLHKSSTFSGGVGSYLVGMNNEFSPVNLREKRREFL